MSTNSPGENGVVSGQLLLAFLPSARENPENQRGILDGEAFEKQEKGFGGDPYLAGRGLESGQVLGPRIQKQKLACPLVGKIRHLTETELERIAGFPDGWTEEGTRIQRGAAIGNSVIPQIGRAHV